MADYTGHKVLENPQLYLTPEEMKNIERNKRIQEKFLAECCIEQARLNRNLNTDEKVVIRKRLLAEEP
jgi:hypothetical protein